MDPPFPATLNAFLNSTSAVLLVAGFFAIRRRRFRTHAGLMVGALGVSTLFLISYVLYHLEYGSVRYAGEGGWRIVYYSILVPHVILAALLLPLVLRLVYLAWRRRWESHKRLARWAFPVWIYVSVSGVLVYWMLYQL